MEQKQMKEIKDIVVLKPKKQKDITIHTTDSEKVAEALNQLNIIATTIKSSLKDGTDYGIIPNCGKKPTLFKSGAQKIALLFKLIAKFEKVKDIQDRENGYVQVEYQCSLWTNQGTEIAQGVGIETSEEKKHKGINPFSIINTITKMAKKRALVDAVLMIGNLSEVFTQDVEDMATSTLNIEQQLTKDEKLSLYGTTYDKFKNIHEWTKLKDKKTDWQNKVKEFVFKQILPSIGIKKRHFLEFEKADADIYLKWLNEYKNETTSEDK